MLVAFTSTKSQGKDVWVELNVDPCTDWAQKSKSRTTPQIENRSRKDLRIAFQNGFSAIGAMQVPSGTL